MANLFRQALEVLDKKDRGAELTKEECKLLNAALIPLNIRGCPFPGDMAISKCLEELAKIIEEAE